MEEKLFVFIRRKSTLVYACVATDVAEALINVKNEREKSGASEIKGDENIGKIFT